jgi:hypothetical protein
LAIAAALGLAGCQQKLTLEQARAQCEKKGGLLVVIYSQQITMAGLEPEVASPGDCLSPKNFDPSAPVAPAAPVTPAPAMPPENSKPVN